MYHIPKTLIISFFAELLEAVSEYITNEALLFDLGTRLDIATQKIESIRTDHITNITGASYELLKQWRELPEQLNNTVDELKDKLNDALIDMNMGRIAHDLIVPGHSHD